eukprot:CAMPEP_0196775762 /NCGR_PEP_ID=MMETSP1104-20130614/4224_1 /TAXON_ID=33652 /ORGANISM="Cafeteria sp., Strain Caron Lab Isolate" /LENGTH=109 /DNA_ID=CAMNT_0042145933 /DNA_START=131 /DNA_END=458 /DNA_ORIENTATION=-
MCDGDTTKRYRGGELLWVWRAYGRLVVDDAGPEAVHGNPRAPPGRPGPGSAVRDLLFTCGVKFSEGAVMAEDKTDDRFLATADDGEVLAFLSRDLTVRLRERRPRGEPL